ncbi:MAG: DUF1631 family protein [Pseudomonadota bacterium]
MSLPPAYEACVADAIAHSGALMQRVLGPAREGLSRLQGTRAGAVPEALHLLGQHEAFLAARFPEALDEVVRGTGAVPDSGGGAQAPEAELSLADDAQVDERIELTRSRQTTMRTVAAPLAEFTSLVCAARGLLVVRSDANPLAPDVYIRALQALVDRTGASKVARVLWMQHLCGALGPQLVIEYERLSVLLRAAGVEPAAYAVVQTGGDAAAAPVVVRAPADPEVAAAARRIAAEIAAWPEIDRVPPAVRDFVYGPWAEVIAKARANAGAGPTDPGGAYALVRPLFWSAQPELGRSDVQRLMTMVPSLVSRLRTGLQTIDYPAAETEAFFKALNELHGIAARAPGSSFALRKSRRDGGGPGGDIAGRGGRPALPGASETVPDHSLSVSANALEVLFLGVWVESFAGKGWKRMQLTWVSPKRALMLFTGEDGSTESMSRRGCLRRMRDGQLRIVPDLDLDIFA